MNGNLLLSYLSELHAGKKVQLRNAIEAVSSDDDDTPWSAVARHLSVLGHIEVNFASDMSWAVCPPVIAWLPHDDRDEIVGVLCGSRQQPLLQTLQQAADTLDCTLEYVSQDEGPDVVQIVVPSSDVGEQLAAQCHVASQPDAAALMLDALPSISDYLALCSEAAEPRGYPIQRFDDQQMKWIDVEDSAENGFYRYRSYIRHHRLKVNGRTLDVPPQIGIFAWLHHQKQIVMRYDHDKQEIITPASAVLLPVFGRIAVLCSGQLPVFHYGDHIYQRVPLNTARRLINRLHQ